MHLGAEQNSPKIRSQKKKKKNKEEGKGNKEHGAQ